MNYSRMPGPGDLPGDNSHPNSPDFNDEPFWAAAETVGNSMPRADVVELVERLVAAENAMALAIEGRELSFVSRGALADLLQHAKGLASDVQKAMRDAA